MSIIDNNGKSIKCKIITGNVQRKYFLLIKPMNFLRNRHHIFKDKTESKTTSFLRFPKIPAKFWPVRSALLFYFQE